MDVLKTALLQIRVKSDKKENLLKAEKMIKEAAENGARLIILPEMFNTPYESSNFPVYAEEYPGETNNMLSRLSKELGVFIAGGSIPEREGDKVYNTAYVYSDLGKVVAKHRKAHLFDIDVEGGITFKESETLTAGDSSTIFTIDGMKVGVIICYDIRFPEFSRRLSLDGAEAIIVPAAFNMTTGPAHWHTTARARALDNQVYMLMCSPARDVISSYVAYGHSIVTNPWGCIVGQCGTDESILYADLDRNHVRGIREQLPLLKHRRPELY
ncbi:MAG: carbon-nitrogen hydrolase family protein [Gudongella sp.]|jgi:predicted amidohydrolase|nr:carbon-nitrogen hydrolase family protein [Gudongella sp.]